MPLRRPDPLALAGTALAPLSGAAMALAFPGASLSFLALPALAAFFALALSAPPRRAAVRGFAWGFVFFGLLLRWFASVLLDFTGLGPAIALGAVLASGAILGAFTAALSWALARLAARFGVLVALAMAPFAWCGIEAWRSLVPFPFPWGTLPAALASLIPARDAAALVGTSGVGLLGALVASALALVAFSPRRGVLALGAALVLFGLAALGGALVRPEPTRVVRAAVVQGSLSREAHSLDALEVYEGLTREASAAGAELVVWPESATRYRLDAHAGYRTRLELLAAALDVDIVLNTLATPDPDTLHNAAAIVRADGLPAAYVAKRRLVPFGEYLPLRFIFRNAPAIAAEAGDFDPGEGPPILPSRAGRIGTLVCYESVFPALAAQAASRRADVLVTMTNDSWFGWTSGPRQHLEHGRLRAAETGLPMLRAANTGVSAIIDGRGTIVAELGLGARGMLSAPLGIPARSAPGAALGRVLGVACAIFALAVLGAALIFRPTRAAPLASSEELPEPGASSARAENQDSSDA